MTRLKNISLLLQWIFAASLILLPLMHLFLWVISALVPWQNTFFGEIFHHNILGITIQTLGKTYSVGELHLSWTARLIGMSGSVGQNAFQWVALFYVMQLMKLYRKGNIFSQCHGYYFKRIGQCLFVYGTLGLVIGEAFHGLALTFDNPPGERLLTFSFGSSNIVILVIACMVTVVGWITLEGFKLRTAQDLTI